MGELYGRWSRAVDSNLAIMPNAKLYVFDSVAKTTPKTTYSDAACTVESANPISANPDGRFPQVFAPVGQNFYLVLRSNTIAAGGVIIDTFESVSALGGATTGLSLDFDNGGKARIVGDSGLGAARLEFGDPDPDVVGGSGVVSGWAGTQLDNLSLDVAQIDCTGDIDVTGEITVGGLPLAGVVRTENTVFSAVSHVDIPLTNDPLGALVYDVDIIQFLVSTSGSGLTARFSYDGGGTFPSTSIYDNTVLSAHGTTVAATAGGGTSGILANAVNAVAAELGSIRFRVVTTDDVSVATHAQGVVQTRSSLDLALFQAHFLINCSNGGRATHIRLLISAGTISGRYRVVPQRGFGEA